MTSQTIWTGALLIQAIRAPLIICICLFVCGVWVLGQDKESKTENPDSTFGKGGKKVVTTSGSGRKDEVVETKLIDSKGVVREEKRLVTTPRGKSEEIKRYDCNGKLLTRSRVETDESGKEISSQREIYKDGVLQEGTITGAEGNKVFNPQTQRYEETSSDYKKLEKFDPLPLHPLECPTDLPSNELTGLFSTIREDSEPEPFNTHGFNAAYTRYLNERFGVTVDFSANFRERGGVELSKYSFTGGLTVLPIEVATTDNRVTVFAHALFGGAHFSADSGVGSFMDNTFTMKLGAGLDVNVNRNFFIRPIQIDYTPTFFGNNTQHNVQVGFGAGFRF